METRSREPIDIIELCITGFMKVVISSAEASIDSTVWAEHLNIARIKAKIEARSKRAYFSDNYFL